MVKAVATMFSEVKGADFPGLEQEVMAFWREHEIFKKSVEKPSPRGEYVFYEGPPTANGQPALHHVLARSFKDLFPRFKSMQGYHAPRRGGWDTHGLPVEISVEKKLGLQGRNHDATREELETFNRLCRESVWSTIQDWNTFTERLGFWVDLNDAYITYENPYIESVWNLLKRLWVKGLVAQDYKVVPLSPRIATTLSKAELGEEDSYREVDDPSVYVRFPVKPETTPQAVLDEFEAQGVSLSDLPGLALVVWTTTPWTLPSNTMAAVNPELTYAVCSSPNGPIIIAQDAVERVSALHSEPLTVLATLKGHDMEFWAYTQPFPEVAQELGVTGRMHFVALADFVSAQDGSGVAHEAPVYGAEDLELSRVYETPLVFGTDEHGVMQVTHARGQFFKDADKALIADLETRGLMVWAGTFRHRYPFHDRTGDPILYFAKPSWYVRTQQMAPELLEQNEKINWVPKNIKHGRFGRWLEGNVDWAISRERYWGTPLPFWVAEDGSELICVGSVQELSELAGRDLSELDLHRPYIDDVTFSKDGKLFRRVPEVLDVWFDSGSMPYAQWHLLLNADGETPLPGTEENLAQFERHFPADFICEAIDQTRGWFYSLHAISTLLYGTPAYKNVICLGHIVDEHGKKMSKSKGNVIKPIPLFDQYGADCVRWYMFSASEPGDQKRFSPALVEETQRDLFMTLWNTYSFFVLYANLDTPDLTQTVPVAERPEIDRWLVAKTHALVRDVTGRLETYDPTAASRLVRDFVVDDLSNWYVRRNRRRFWKSGADTDKLAAYGTLYETLVTLTKLMAPLAPFVSEAIYRNLVLAVTPDAPESVHLSQWPEADAALIDDALLRDMNALVRVVELGRGARAASKVKTRQPLPEVLVRVRSAEELEGLRTLEPQLLEELNVKKVTYLEVTADFVAYDVKPNLPLVGKRFGKLIPALKKAINEMDGRDIARNVREGKETPLTLDGQEYRLEPEAFLLDAKSPEGYTALEERGYLAALNTQLTPELVQEGLARDVIRLVQNARKNAGLEVSDTIQLSLQTTGELAEAVKTHLETIQSEVLAAELDLEPLRDAAYNDYVEVEGTPLVISLSKVVKPQPV